VLREFGRRRNGYEKRRVSGRESQDYFGVENGIGRMERQWKTELEEWKRQWKGLYGMDEKKAMENGIGRMEKAMEGLG
jgi:hypothetical protein